MPLMFCSGFFFVINILQAKNKKSSESDVAPAGIKSYKFLFVFKKIYFAVFKKLMGYFVRKMDKVENLEYWLAKFDLTCPLFHKILILSGYHFCPLIKASNSAEN